MALTLEDIESLFHRKGRAQYSGEPVTHLDNEAKKGNCRTPDLAHRLSRARRCMRGASA